MHRTCVERLPMNGSGRGGSSGLSMRQGGVGDYAVHGQGRSGGKRWSSILVKHKKYKWSARPNLQTQTAQRDKNHVPT